MSGSFEFFRNFCSISRVETKTVTKIWTRGPGLSSNSYCLVVSHSIHYTRVFSVILWCFNLRIFMHGWFCLIHLIYLIGRKSLHFEQKIRMAQIKLLIDIWKINNFEKGFLKGMVPQFSMTMVALLPQTKE